MTPRLAIITLALLLASCGLGRTPFHRHRIVFETLENPAYLGLTWEGGDEWRCALNPVLAIDEDSDKATRVAIHEMENVRVLYSGAWPDGMEYGWYLVDSDTLPPFWPMPEAEAAWLASLPTFSVVVEDAWMEEPVRLAEERIEEAIAGLDP